MTPEEEYQERHGLCSILLKTTIPTQSAGDLVVSTAVVCICIDEQEGWRIVVETRAFGVDMPWAIESVSHRGMRSNREELLSDIRRHAEMVERVCQWRLDLSGSGGGK